MATTRQLQGQASRYTPNEIKRLISEEARRQGVDPFLALSLVQQESGFNPNALSKSGAIGLFQLMPATARGLKVDPNNVEANIQGGITYLKQQLKTYKGNVNTALAAYNAGPVAVQAFRDGKSIRVGDKIINPNKIKTPDGIPPYRETQGYVKNINANYRALTSRLPNKTNPLEEVAQGLGQGLSAGLYKAPDRFQGKPATFGASVVGQLATAAGANAILPGVGAIAALGAQGAGNEYRRQFDEIAEGTRQDYSPGRIAASTAANSLLGLLPVSAPGNLIQRAASGAALGGGGNLAANVAGNILDPSNQRNPLEGVGEGAALGGAFGAAFGARRPSTPAPAPTVETLAINPGSNNVEQMLLNLYSELPKPTVDQQVQASILPSVDNTQQGNLFSNQYTQPPMPEGYGLGSTPLLPEFSTAEAQMLPQGQVLVGGQDGLVPSQPVGDLGIIQQQLQPEPLLDNTQQQVLPLDVQRPLSSPISPLADQLGTMPTPRVNEGLAEAIQTPDLVADSLPGPGQQMLDFSRPPIEIQPLSPYDAGTYVKPPQLKQQFTNVETGKRVDINFNNPVEVAMSNMTKGKTTSKPDLAYLKQAIPGATDEQLINIAKRYRKEVINKTIKTGEPIPEAALQDLVNQETLATKNIPVEAPQSKIAVQKDIESVVKSSPEPIKLAEQPIDPLKVLEVDTLGERPTEYTPPPVSKVKEVLPESAYVPRSTPTPEGAIRVATIPAEQRITPEEAIARLAGARDNYISPTGQVIRAMDAGEVARLAEIAANDPNLELKIRYYTDIKGVGEEVASNIDPDGTSEQVIKPLGIKVTTNNRNTKLKTPKPAVQSTPLIDAVNQNQEKASFAIRDLDRVVKRQVEKGKKATYDSAEPAAIIHAELVPATGIDPSYFYPNERSFAKSKDLIALRKSISETLSSLPEEQRLEVANKMLNVPQGKIAKKINPDALIESLNIVQLKNLKKELGC